MNIETVYLIEKFTNSEPVYWAASSWCPDISYGIRFMDPEHAGKVLTHILGGNGRVIGVSLT